MYGHMITKFSGMGRLPHFLSYGAPPMRALRAGSQLTALAGESEVSFHFHFHVGVTLYQLTCREKTTGLLSEPAVITVSGCLILTAVNSSSYRWLTKC